jgi:hypothetical protein
VTIQAERIEHLGKSSGVRRWSAFMLQLFEAGESCVVEMQDLAMDVSSARGEGDAIVCAEARRFVVAGE